MVSFGGRIASVVPGGGLLRLLLTRSIAGTLTTNSAKSGCGCAGGGGGEDTKGQRSWGRRKAGGRGRVASGWQWTQQMDTVSHGVGSVRAVRRWVLQVRLWGDTLQNGAEHGACTLCVTALTDVYSARRHKTQKAYVGGRWETVNSNVLSNASRHVGTGGQHHKGRRWLPLARTAFNVRRISSQARRSLVEVSARHHMLRLWKRSCSS